MLTGGEKTSKFHILSKNGDIYNIFSPSVAFGDSSLVRGSLGRSRARGFIDNLMAAPVGAAMNLIYQA